MTEDEAKTKLCVHRIGSKAVYTPGPHGSTFTTVPTESNCVGSQCMAWRWLPYMLGPDPEMTTVTTNAAPDRYRPEGYCGLAGKP